MGEWKKVTIGELCDAGHASLQTGPFGSQLHAHDYTEEGIPVVPTEAIVDRAIDHGLLPRISPEKAIELDRHRLKPGDILFARRGVRAAGHAGFVRSHESGFICGTGAIRLRMAGERVSVSASYLSHALTSPASVKWFKDNAVGSTMPNLNPQIIRNFSLEVPSLREQAAIGMILESYEDLIENNTKRIGVLEEMARVLYRGWFARPASRRDLPTSWKRTHFGHLVSLSKDTVTPRDTPDTAYDLFSFEARDLGSLPIATFGESIQSNKFVVPDGVVLLPKLNPHIPRVWLPFFEGDRPKICSTEFLVLRPSSGIPRTFLYAMVEDGSFSAGLAQRADGTSNSHKRLKPDDVLAQPVCLPPGELLERFDAFASGVFEQCHVLRKKNRALRAARDLLLPKLLSGELSVDRIPDPAEVAP